MSPCGQRAPRPELLREFVKKTIKRHKTITKTCTITIKTKTSTEAGNTYEGPK